MYIIGNRKLSELISYLRFRIYESDFYSIFEAELAETIPVIHASIAGCRIIGRLCVGEKNKYMYYQIISNAKLMN